MNTVLVSCLCAVIVGAHFADAQPVFADGTTGAANVAEKSIVGTLVITVTANAGATGADITYTIQSQTPTTSPFVFAVGETTGAVTVFGDIDYESVTSYVVVVRASEVGSTTVDKQLTLTVTDVTEIAPSFSSAASIVRIDDAAIVGTPLITVTATDANTGDTITYSMTGSADFDINTATGAITSLSVMNQATTPLYALIVTATDNDNMSGLTTLAVCVGTTDECSSGAPVILCGYTALLMFLFMMLIR